ncbi:glycosyltransferase family A protein [Flavivirga amylovorans]|uniref:Glycosyltransferase family A protein n=1 Tax=Flavivirga amylovorans TaxID=870486 RepID=A0ABT8WYE6_9FLAO|nr:glycosyltransferase family A protein [Flavivirga amylovorans]MDO5986394.1 glycosyltransferase family A protein [Flavivirga amylovorans]
MILLVHKDNRVIEIIDLKTDKSIDFTNSNPVEALFHVAKNNIESILIWCHKSLKENLNINGIETSFHLKNMMLSYSTEQYVPEQIGYIEDSPFLKVNKRVKYPTWLMSNQVGVIHASQLLKFENKINYNNSFDFFLNSIAKTGMPQGLFCYSEPKLLNDLNLLTESGKASKFELFKFARLHYKGVWSFLLFLNLIVYERKFPLFSFFKNVFSNQKKIKLEFEQEPLSLNKTNLGISIDVIIPTVGRKEYLHDVLIDLSNQTKLPEKVIIVEQNEDINSKTELDFIANNIWPFMIIHKFIHKMGACNARNLALKEVTADYLYLADDDNKFKNNLLEDVITKMTYYDLDVITMSYLQENEVEIHNKPLQWSTFGAGSSVMASKFLEQIKFNLALEFGYGEDADFGMQLRNSGADVIYFPDIKIKHLKAPIGGFRTPFKHPWFKEEVQPKPSPTVMLNRMNNSTKHQLLGYKTKLFLKYYKSQNIKNPIRYFKLFKKQWQFSQFWANTLKEQHK